MASGPETAVRLSGITKSFGSTRVVKGVDLEFRKGEVHALIGENGAGKSTIGKIVGGYYSADGGTIEVFGEKAEHWNPRRALQHGIAMIHQELQLVPALTVAQNVFLGIESNVGGVLRGSEASRFAVLEEHCKFGLDPDQPVGSLRIAERQKVEIMRAIARDAKVIIMDEPTSSLTADEATKLHEVIAWLKAGGATIVYVTHFLDHVLETADRVTVMRDGAAVQTSDIKGQTKQSLVEAMLGEPADVAFPVLPPAPRSDLKPVVEAIGLTTEAGLDEASIVVRPGEIVGLVGLVGSGRSELARAIFGADRLVSGKILVNGARYERPSPRASVAHGIAFVPEDRRKQGLVLSQRVRPNMSLPHLGLVSRLGVVGQAGERRRTAQYVDHFEIHPQAIDGDVAFYSGGNQQKVLLSKWMYGSPKFIMLDEPSRGVDIGARRRIHDFIIEAAAGGAGVLLISSELEEVLAMSHRGYLMSQGKVLGEIDPKSVGVADVLFRLFNVGTADASAPAGESRPATREAIRQ